jgi:hypothetical protein
MRKIAAEVFYFAPDEGATFARNDYHKWAEVMRRAHIEPS